MEIKTVRGAKWYQSVREKKRAVERRVAAIGEEYEDNAKAADAKLECMTARDQCQVGWR